MTTMVEPTGISSGCATNIPVTTITNDEIIPNNNVFLKLFVSWLAIIEGKTTRAEINNVPIVLTPITMKKAVKPASKYPRIWTFTFENFA